VLHALGELPLTVFAHAIPLPGSTLVGAVAGPEAAGHDGERLAQTGALVERGGEVGRVGLDRPDRFDEAGSGWCQQPARASQGWTMTARSVA